MANFQAPFLKHLAFPTFWQIQLKIYMLAGYLMKFSGMKFHVAMQP